MSKKAWDYFLELCRSAEEREMLSDTLDLFLTPEEKSSVEMRCLIIKELLEQKKPQRKISEDLNVSIAKITRGSNELKRISPKLKLFLLQYLCRVGKA